MLASAWSSDREKTIFTEHQCGEIVCDRFESRRVVKALKDVRETTKTRSKAVFSLLRVGKLIIQELYKKADISSKRVCRLRTSDSPRSFRHAFGTSLPWKSTVIRDLRIIFTIEYLSYANTLVFRPTYI